MSSKPTLVKGSENGVNLTPLKDGQLLLDIETGSYYLDTTIDGTLTRYLLSKKPFVGTTAAWEALTDAEKAKYADTDVIINDDLSDTSSVMEGATASTAGKVGLVPQPLPGDNSKVLYGDGTWRTLESVITWIGVTTTPISDRDSTNPILINGEYVTAVGGNMTAYNGEEFVWDADNEIWQLFGHAVYNFGSLAFKDAATGSYTPEGNIGIAVQTAPSTATVNSIREVGTLPTFTIVGETATFNPGTLPTKGTDQNVLTNIGQLSASFEGTASTVIVS